MIEIVRAHLVAAPCEQIRPLVDDDVRPPECVGRGERAEICSGNGSGGEVVRGRFVFDRVQFATERAAG